MALIHWWPLTEDTSDHIDSSHTQTVTALPTSLKGNGVSKRAGKVSLNTFDFNGSGSLIDTGVQQSSLGNNWTISAWLFADTNTNYRDAIGRHNNGGNGGFCFAEFNGGGSGAIGFCIVGIDSSWQSVYSAVNTTLPLNTWTHFTMVVKDGKTIQVYKNGEFVGSDSNLANLNINWNPIGTILIGMSFNTPDRYWDGAIQDIRIYDGPLSPKEIKKLAQGLIIHYNPDQAIRSSIWVGDYGYWWTNNVPRVTQSIVSDSSLPSGEYKKFTWTATGSLGGPYFYNNEPMTKGATYTTSFYWKSYGYKPNINSEYYSPQKVYTTLAPNGWWYTQVVGKKIFPCNSNSLTFYATPPNGTACELDVSSIKIEPGDFATPYRRDNKSCVPDSSGFGYDGAIVSEAIEKSTDHKWKKNIVADGDPEHYIQSNINPSFLTSGVTLNVWYKNITNKVFLIARGQTNYYHIMVVEDADKRSGGVSGETYYIDGQCRTKTDGYPKDGQWHMYTSVHTSIGGWTALYWNHFSSEWAYNGPLGDIRVYATALSAEDVKNLYNETRVTHPMQFLISNSSALSSLTSSNPVLVDGELVVARSTVDGKTYFNIRKGNGVNNFNSLPWKRISEATLKGWRNSFNSDSAALDADTGSYTQLGGVLIDRNGNKYYQVDYIENTSNSFIQTDYCPRTSVSEMEVQFRKIGTRDNYSPIVNSEDDIRYGIMCSRGALNDHLAYWIGSASKYAVKDIDLGATFYQKNTFKISHEGFYVNGTKIYTPSSSLVGDYTASWGICVGARQNGGGPNYSDERTYGRWYSVKFSENGKIVRNYVPVKSESGVYGLFDAINNKFFSSKTSNGFVGGFE